MNRTAWIAGAASAALLIATPALAKKRWFGQTAAAGVVITSVVNEADTAALRIECGGGFRETNLPYHEDGELILTAPQIKAAKDVKLVLVIDGVDYDFEGASCSAGECTYGVGGRNFVNAMARALTEVGKAKTLEVRIPALKVRERFSTAFAKDYLADGLYSCFED